MRPYHRSLCIILTGILLSACAKHAPDWVQGSAKDYPTEQYLTATGTADNIEDARTRALANLAKIFTVSIDDSSYDAAQAWQRTADGAVEQGQIQRAARYVDAYSSKLLEGAQIVEQWQDQQRHYALAVISRAQLSTQLRSEIHEYDRQTKNLLAQAQTTADAFASAQILSQAQTLQIQRALLQQDLQIVDRSGAGIRPRWSVAGLQQNIDQTLAQMTVAPEVLSDPLQLLNADLKTAIAAAGMTYLASDDAVYRLQAAMEIDNPGLQDGWYWYRGALTVTLIQQADNRVVASQRWPLKAAGQSEAQAARRLHTQVVDLLSTSLKPALLDFANNSHPSTNGS